MISWSICILLGARWIQGNGGMAGNKRQLVSNPDVRTRSRESNWLQVSVMCREYGSVAAMLIIRIALIVSYKIRIIYSLIMQNKARNGSLN